ncbi:MAG: recombination regulator RecX [Neisseria sp.]|nr:recombination regulator RecX [Neisseria sp.]
MTIQKSLRSRALDILSRREVSRLELKRKLAPYAEAENEEEIDKVLEEFADRNWQSDERYAEAYVYSKSRKYGSLRLLHDLSAKGVERELIQAHLPDREQELANACAVLRKKFPSPADNPKDKQKQARFLAYRGFSTDTAYRAMQTAWHEEENS